MQHEDLLPVAGRPRRSAAWCVPLLWVTAMGACGGDSVRAEPGAHRGARVAPPGPAPTERVCADGELTFGIDVSKWQGDVDWVAVRAEGVEFAFIRAADGATYIDERFEQNWRRARHAGVIRGAYQFFRPEEDPVEQADVFVEVVGRLRPGDLPPVVDVESDGGLPPDEVQLRLQRWLERVEQRMGVRPIIYTSRRLWRRTTGDSTKFADYPLWIAGWFAWEGPDMACPDVPPAWSRWVFWQDSEDDRVDGIRGPVDSDWFQGSVEDLRSWAMPRHPSRRAAKRRR